MSDDGLDWIREGLKQPGKSQAGLARAMGRAPPAVSNMLSKSGKKRRLLAEEIPVIAAYLGVQPPAVAATSDVELIAVRDRLVPVRVVGTVEAGAFREVDEFDQSEFEEIYDTPDPKFPNARRAAWTVSGDSMDALRPRPILSGDKVICVDFDDLHGKVPLRDDMVVVVERTRDGGMTREWSVKQIEIYDDRTEFHPRSNNPRHKPIVVHHDLHADDGQQVSVLALVRRVVNDIPM